MADPARTGAPRPGARRRDSGGPSEGWVWGVHAGRAALANPAREVREVLATRNAARDLPAGVTPTLVEPKRIDAVLPPGASHQGLAVRCTAPAPVDLADLATPAAGALIVLDQITDPHNVGAILRTAAAFGARGAVLQDRKAPPLFGACAKAAAGAAETLPLARVVNIARALGELRAAGWRAVGLAGEADTPIATAFEGADAVALVLGAEGKGIRPSVADACDARARIPIAPDVESLNVSTAAAIALYELTRRDDEG